jgi:hypothetical protein
VSKDRSTTGIDGLALPLLPPERDARVWARLVRIMFYLPGFMALLLIKAGEPASFGITVELLMLSSAAAIVGGIFIGAESTGTGADAASKVGVWSGSLILELLAVVPFLCAVPPLFHELAHSRLLHVAGPDTIDISLSGSEFLPAVAILPFMIYQLAGFGTLHFVVSRSVNWIISFAILFLIVVGYVANREAAYGIEKFSDAILVVSMGFIVFYGVLRLKQMQTDYDTRCPPKPPK